ncbi:hypothetical protein GMRT_13119 [Giardia muris]|uniref:Uncharacterized protein n=1 Tax=Giardia muris TaxID=5742 RepID=A0A4Z1T4D6_GIAMU|nr:hypothetical protein GMRT_13119 [Giardia muris]|eukprot:TNJ30528.1 hypothetical protein GMRT_13119 [Giardia muris]
MSIGGRMAMCPPVFTGDASKVILGTGTALYVLSATSLAVLREYPIPKRNLVKLLFGYGSDTQLLILSRHKLAFFSLEAETLSHEVDLPENSPYEFADMIYPAGAGMLLLVLRNQQREHQIVVDTVSHILSSTELNDPVLRLILKPPPSLGIHRPTGTMRHTQCFTSGGILYLIIDHSVLFARYSSTMKAEDFKSVVHDMLITAGAPLTLQTKPGFVITDDRHRMYTFEGPPAGETVETSFLRVDKWHRVTVTAIAIANSTSLVPKIITGGFEDAIVVWPTEDWSPLIVPYTFGSARYIVTPSPSQLLPEAFSVRQMALLVTAANSLHLIDTATGSVIASRFGIVTPSNVVAFTPVDVAGFRLYEADQLCALMDSVPGEAQIIRGVDTVPSSAFLPPAHTTMLQVIPRNKVYSPIQFPKPPHVCHMAVLRRGEVLAFVTRAKINGDVWQEESLRVFHRKGEEYVCNCQIFRPTSSHIRLLTPLTADPDCSTFVLVGGFELRILTLIEEKVVEIFFEEICDCCDETRRIVTAGLDSEGRWFGVLIRGENTTELLVYELEESMKEGMVCIESCKKHTKIVIPLQPETTPQVRSEYCSVGSRCIHVSDGRNAYIYSFETEGLTPLTLPIKFNIHASPHIDKDGNHYLIGSKDSVGYLCRLNEEGVVETQEILESTKTTRLVGVDCTMDGRVFVIIKNTREGRRLVQVRGEREGYIARPYQEVAGEEEKEGVDVAKRPEAPIVGFGMTVQTLTVTDVETSTDMGSLTKEPSHRLGNFTTRLTSMLTVF